MKAKRTKSEYKSLTTSSTGKEKPTTKSGRKKKMGIVMDEWKHGELKTNAGKVVKDQKQAVAIALSESGQSNRDKKKSIRK